MDPDGESGLGIKACDFCRILDPVADRSSGRNFPVRPLPEENTGRKQGDPCIGNIKMTIHIEYHFSVHLFRDAEEFIFRSVYVKIRQSYTEFLLLVSIQGSLPAEIFKIQSGAYI